GIVASQRGVYRPEGKRAARAQWRCPYRWRQSTLGELGVLFAAHRQRRPRPWPPGSRQYSSHYKRRHGAGELLIQTLESITELVVVYTQAMKNGRIEVAHVHRIIYHVIAIVVGLAIGDSGAHAGAGHPGGETARVMVAAIVLLAQPALAVYGPPEFTCPDHPRLIE